ncbi:hypothetical protein LPB72_03555 [Hydrogenophaga crassostreae]|uniref:Glycoside hydrolase family 19 catalytic domain-containing protein n=1 Tax=Hydrogenophaga crassostreae TaxID=1763535 RepID=A0A162T5B6_9BURK|nr:glycoside hydrolase family 19 protein [Hydrogenophaga crassostreae]AOW14362.1 hypothetical protein LPB072_17480 [Hydrogenophaga crassostreae]OAD43615.1 hypothetical protein LPB72_03555 [Hydrogenophaga crassostreae]
MADPNIPHLSGAQQMQRAESLLVAAYRSGMTDPKELANFMGQVQHESQNFSRLEENLNYSGSRLYDVFPGRNGLTREGAQAITDMPDASERRQAVAEQVYGGDWGARRLGNTEAGDGYAFRGRGYMQLTGRNNYEHFGEATGLDLINQPGLAANEAHAERLAISYWNENVQAVQTARTDVTQAGSIINTGGPDKIPNGLADRQANATAWETAFNNGYLQEALARHPAAVTPVEAEEATRNPQALQLKPELQLSPHSLALIQDSEQQVRQIAERHQLPWDAGLNNTAHAVASQARQEGLTGITHLNVSNGQIRYAQFDGLTLKEGALDARAAANTDAQTSVDQMARADQLTLTQLPEVASTQAQRQEVHAPAH